MKTLLQRFTRWFNRTHERSGTLWEQRYKSVIVESGLAARTIAAHMDLNPVWAGWFRIRWITGGADTARPWVAGPRGTGRNQEKGLSVRV
jgi:hypothetical protein